MKNEEEFRKKIIRQNEVIISLLGRIAFTEEKVREIVTKNKQNPERYIEGYNFCDGKHTQSQIAEVVGVSAQMIGRVLRQWEEVGIIYEVERKGGKFYKKLFPI